MAFVKAKPNESIDSLLKRFKRAVEKSGVLSDLKKHEFYDKPSVKRKKKQAAARKRALKREKKLAARKARVGTNKNFKWNKDRTKKIPLKPRPKNSGSGYQGKGRSNRNNQNSNFKKSPSGPKTKNFNRPNSRKSSNYKPRQGKDK